MINQGRLASATDKLAEVFKDQPGNTMLAYTLGHFCELLGAESRAVQYYQDCLKFKSHLQLPRQRMGAIYLKNCQFENAAGEYEQLIDQHRGDVASHVLLGHLYNAGGRYNEAADSFNKAILIHPDNFNQGFDEIDDLLHQQQYYRACEELEQMIETAELLEPGMLAKYAEALNLAGQIEQAVMKYQQAIEQCPEYLEAHIKLGTLYLQTNQTTAAAQKFNQAMEINDRIVDAYIGLCTAQSLADKSCDALGTLSLAAAVQPNSSILMAESAALQLGCERQTDSSAQIQQIIEAHRVLMADNNSNPELRYRMAILLMSTENHAQAARCLAEAMKINPSHHPARTKLAICLFEMGYKAQAVYYLTEDITPQAKTLKLHYKTALLYADRIKFASSMLNLERQMQTNYAQFDANVNISVVLQNMGLLDRATALWESLAELPAGYSI